MEVMGAGASILISNLVKETPMSTWRAWDVPLSWGAWWTAGV